MAIHLKLRGGLYKFQIMAHMHSQKNERNEIKQRKQTKIEQTDLQVQRKGKIFDTYLRHRNVEIGK